MTPTHDSIRGWFAAALILVLVSGCCRKCLEGHWEHRHTAEHEKTILTTLTGLPYFGKGVPIKRTRMVPARDWNEWVCDKYEP